MGTNLPTTAGQTITPLTGTTGGSASLRDFVLFDLNNDGTPDRMYVADERTNGLGGLQRWTSSDGANWTLEITFTTAAGTGLRGLTGQVVDGSPVLFATTAITSSAGNQLVSLTDSGDSSTFVALATAGGNTAFRGVALAPAAVPEPGGLSLAAVVVALGAVVAARRRWRERSAGSSV